jgi:hypothetical protein
MERNLYNTSSDALLKELIERKTAYMRQVEQQTRENIEVSMAALTEEVTAKLQDIKKEMLQVSVANLVKRQKHQQQHHHQHQQQQKSKSPSAERHAKRSPIRPGRPPRTPGRPLHTPVPSQTAFRATAAATAAGSGGGRYTAAGAAHHQQISSGSVGYFDAEEHADAAAAAEQQHQPLRGGSGGGGGRQRFMPLHTPRVVASGPTAGRFAQERFVQEQTIEEEETY